MNKKLFWFFAGLVILSALSISRDVYRVYPDKFPIIKEYENFLEKQKSELVPVTVFDECPGGVCPVR